VGPAQLDGFRRNGWRAPDELGEDYALVDARVAVRGAGAPDPTVLQLTYTDGIAVVSLFEQRGDLDPEPVAAWDRRRRGGGTVYVDAGTPQRMVWAASGSVYTLVSDDPDVVDDALAALPEPPPPPGVLHRVERGLRRLGSWVNPFG
jgi:sigma-E factor negative regulatory protein RseB